MTGNVLVVCHGNTHRSALAHAVLARMLGEDRVRSCGVRPNAGGPAALKVREFAMEHGYDLSGHRATRVTAELLDWADVILYMDAGNLRRLVALGVRADDDRLKCMAEFVGEKRIPDPGFIPRGDELTRILTLVIRAAGKAGEFLAAQSPSNTGRL